MNTATEINHNAERDRSYRTRVTKGQRVRTLRPVNAHRVTDDGSYEHHTLPTDAVLEVFAESNAGFRGIELFAFVNIGARRYSVSVSTGAVAKL